MHKTSAENAATPEESTALDLWVTPYSKLEDVTLIVQHKKEIGCLDVVVTTLGNLHTN